MFASSIFSTSALFVVIGSKIFKHGGILQQFSICRTSVITDPAAHSPDRQLVYTNQNQITEFAGYLPEGTEMLPLCETEQESIEADMRLLQSIEKRFQRQ
jgi:hypothetical protein